MALIKCPDCGREVSENAKTCMYCGAPLKKDEKEKVVLIKTPVFTTYKVAAANSNECSIKSGERELWNGHAGETAKFKIEDEIDIDIYFME